jgi:hypothetical protein
LEKIDFKLDDALELVNKYEIESIREVLKELEERGSQIINPKGFVKDWLRRGWKRERKNLTMTPSSHSLNTKALEEAEVRHNRMQDAKIREAAEKAREIFKRGRK